MKIFMPKLNHRTIVRQQTTWTLAYPPAEQNDRLISLYMLIENCQRRGQVRKTAICVDGKEAPHSSRLPAPQNFWFHTYAFVPKAGGGIMNIYIKLALAMIVGFGLGAVAVGQLHAQARPPAYVISE